MKKALTATVAGALLLGAAVPALAQEKPLGFSLRLGLYVPTDQGISDPGDAWVGVGVDYRLAHLGRGSSLALSLDYAGKGDSRNVPITLNYILRSHQLYAFAGAGIGFIKDNSDNTTSFAYEGGVGWDFTTGVNPVFLEAKYIGSSNQDVNGIGIYVGVRF